MAQRRGPNIRRVRLFPAAGFTLTELLVVMAIISILASLLIPALSRALDSAKHATCTSNLRQVGLALDSYMQDFSGWSLPNHGPWGGGTSNDCWGWLMQNLGYVPALKSQCAHILICPSIPPYVAKKYVHTYTFRGTRTFPGRPTSFRFAGNIVDCGNSDYGVAAKVYPDGPSKFPLVFGSLADTGPTYGLTLHAYSDGSTLCAPHGGLPNFLFFDWHVGGGFESFDYFSKIRDIHGNVIYKFW